MNKKASVIIKILIVFFSFFGVAVNLACYGIDGYSFWYKRLLYFTTQSNLWIGITHLAYFVLRFAEKKTAKKILGRKYRIIKYVFTVSITLTGVLFCFALAPFMEEKYHPWSFYSVIIHVVVPVLAVLDYLIEKDEPLKREDVWYSLIPPLCYLAFSVALIFAGVDFGRGENYPYFFLNFHSPAGLFGLASADSVYLGTVYWIVLLFMIIIIIGAILLKIKRKYVKVDQTS